MKLNGSRVTTKEIIEYLKPHDKELFSSIRSLRDPSSYDTRELEHKLSRIRKKIEELGVEECKIKIVRRQERFEVKLIDTQEFEDGLDRWSKGKEKRVFYTRQSKSFFDPSYITKKFRIVFYQDREYLGLGDTAVLTLPPQIKYLGKQLKELYLANCGLKKLPREIARLTNLRKLTISSNAIKKIPQEIGGAKNLRVIFARGNQIKAFPESFKKLKRLERLYIDTNKIKVLGPGLKELKQLSELKCANNRISRVTWDLKGLENLTHLDLARNNLTCFPEVLLTLPLLDKLSLDENPIKALPKTLGQMSNLRVLSVRYCSLIEVPYEISEMPRLKELSLCGNDFINFPIAIEKIENLRILSYSSNSKTFFPFRFSGFGKLKELTMQENDFESIPYQIFGLKSVEILDLSNNKLSWVSSRLIELPELAQLNLKENKMLDTLPLSIAYMKHLDELWVEMTPDLESQSELLMKRARGIDKGWGLTETLQYQLISFMGDRQAADSLATLLSEEEKGSLQRFLTSLEKSEVFNRSQKKIMPNVRQMLIDLSKSSIYKEDFFNEITAKAKETQEFRLSMLNALYLIWHNNMIIPHGPIDLSVKDCFRICKTLSLRELIRNEIKKRERKQGHLDAKREEIEFYYEHRLGEELDLITKDLSYEGPLKGKRHWINESQLRIAAHEKGWERLVTNQDFQKIALAQPEVKQAIESTVKRYQKKLALKVRFPKKIKIKRKLPIPISKIKEEEIKYWVESLLASAEWGVSVQWAYPKYAF